MTSQHSSADLDAPVGFWRLRRKSGGAFCLIALNKLKTGRGYGLVKERCSLAETSQATAWRPISGGAELIRMDGSIVLRLHRQSEDVFVDAADQFIMAREPIE